MIPCVLSVLLSTLVQNTFAIDQVRVEVGDGSVLESATVLVRDGRIAAVGRVNVPNGVTRIDGAGKVLAPGFVESRTQIGLTEVGGEARSRDDRMQGVYLPAFRAVEGYNPNSTHIPINREEGVTHALVSPVGGVVSGTAFFVDLRNDPSYRPPPAPVAMFARVGSQGASAAGGARGAVWLGLRELFQDARFYQRNRSAVERGQAPPLSTTPLHLAAMDPVLRRNIPMVLEAHRASDILAALDFAKAEAIRLVIMGGSEAWMVARELAAAGTPVVLKPTHLVPWGFDSLGARDDAAAILHGHGVNVILSAGDWDQNIRRLRQEAGIAVAYGLPRETAMRAITLNPATAFDQARHLGSIEIGKRANMVLWSGDPLEIASVAEYVWIDGVAQSFDHRQRQLVERYLQGPAR